MDIVYAQKDM